MLRLSQRWRPCTVWVYGDKLLTLLIKVKLLTCVLEVQLCVFLSTSYLLRSPLDEFNFSNNTISFTRTLCWTYSYRPQQCGSLLHIYDK